MLGAINASLDWFDKTWTIAVVTAGQAAGLPLTGHHRPND
jgi:hypothetical protein